MFDLPIFHRFSYPENGVKCCLDPLIFVELKLSVRNYEEFQNNESKPEKKTEKENLDHVLIFCELMLLSDKNSDQSKDNRPLEKIPSFYMGHASPGILVDFKSSYAKFLREKMRYHFDEVKGIVIFTSHWDCEVQQISYVQEYELIYDFGDDPYPEECFKITYKAKGDENLAKKIASLFEVKGIKTQFDCQRGLDHAAWILPSLIFPSADTPIVQLSVNSKASPAEQYNIGKTLEPLRNQGILVIASGAIVHNLKLMKPQYQGEDGEKWAVEFDEWVEEKLDEWKSEELFNYKNLAPNSEKAVPTSEHFIPLFIAMGTGDKLKKCDVLHRSYAEGNLSLSTYKFL